MNDLSDSVSDSRKTRGPVDIHVGRRIRERRRGLNISQVELARELGLSVQQVQKYESGDSTVSASRLYQIGIQLAVPPAYFFENMPEEIVARGPGRMSAVLNGNPAPQEIRQMILTYRDIENAELRHQIYELALTLSKAAQNRLKTPAVGEEPVQG